MKDLQNDYNLGIEKLICTANDVERIREDINEKQPKLRQMTIDAEELIEKIQRESEEVVEPKKELI